MHNLFICGYYLHVVSSGYENIWAEDNILASRGSPERVKFSDNRRRAFKKAAERWFVESWVWKYDDKLVGINFGSAGVYSGRVFHSESFTTLIREISSPSSIYRP